MKNILKETWKRIRFIAGITLSWMLVSVATAFGGVELGLKTIVSIFDTTTEKLGGQRDEPIPHKPTSQEGN